MYNRVDNMAASIRQLVSDGTKDNKKSLAERLATEASDWIKSIDIFLYLNYNKNQLFNQ